jgi:16S rRNA (cytosine967-C5)-methyltransferase
MSEIGNLKVHKHLINQIGLALTDIFSSNKYADKVVDTYLKGNKKWGARDRRFFAENVYEGTRWWRLIWWLMDQKSDINSGLNPDFSPEALENFWEVLNWHTKGVLPNVFPMRLSNAELEKRYESPQIPLPVLHSVPDWLFELGSKEFGVERWSKILEILNEPAPVYLRVNVLKTNRRDLKGRLETAGIHVENTEALESALQLKERKNVFVTDMFKEGLFEVQDFSSQHVAPALEVQPGDRVVDACAGAGGKSLHLAGLMKNKGRIIALDIHQWKLEELKKRSRRAGVDIIETRLVDSQKVIKRLESSCNKLLLDVPCSGMGVLRRNPDSKWKQKSEDIERLVKLQAELLDSYSKMLKPGGTLVYSTCSILSDENENQVKNFIANHPEFSIKSQKRFDPDHSEGDGFFYCVMIKA